MHFRQFSSNLIILFLAATCHAQITTEYHHRKFTEEHEHSVDIVAVSFPVFSGPDKGLAAINQWISREKNNFIQRSGVDTTHQFYPSWSAVQVPVHSKLAIDLRWKNERMLFLEMRKDWDDEEYLTGSSVELNFFIADLTSGHIYQDYEWLNEDERVMLNPTLDLLLQNTLNEQDSLLGQPEAHNLNGHWTYEIGTELFYGHFHYYYDREHLTSEQVSIPLDEAKKYMRPEILWLISD